MRYAVYLNDYLDMVFDDFMKARRHGRAMWYLGYEVRYVTYGPDQRVKNRID